jgi:hypothetical protein
MVVDLQRKRCRHCLAAEEPGAAGCPVCGIDRTLRKRDLSPQERKARVHARILRIIAMLHLAAAGTLLIIPRCYPVPPAAAILLGGINLVIAFGLSRYAFWAYRAAVIFYFLIGMVNIISVNIPATLLILVLLYAVGNGTARAIFERRFG